MPLAGLLCPKLVCFGCCCLELFPCGAPEPSPSSPAFLPAVFYQGCSLGSDADDPGNCQPTNGTIPKTPPLFKAGPSSPSSLFSCALLEAFAIPLTCAVALKKPVFEVCRWDGCSFQPVSFTQCPCCRRRACHQAYLLLSGSTGHRADILLTHHVSFSSRLC